MGIYFIQPVKGEDFYVRWNTFWDTPTACGTYYELLTELGYEKTDLDRAEKRFQNPDDGEVYRHPETESPSGFLPYKNMRGLCEVLIDDLPDKEKRVLPFLIEVDDGD